MTNAYRIFPLGDSALTVEFGNEISVELNERAIALSEQLEANPFPGLIEAAPAYASTTIFYDIASVRGAYPRADTAFHAVRTIVERVLTAEVKARRHDGKAIEIPVTFDQTNGLDLEHVAATAGLRADEVVDIFVSRTYRVHMLGFLPGFTYMAEVDDAIAVARKPTPRTRVPKGSVAIAGKQTGIYSLDSPGGWQIIGRTDLEMFTPDAEQPTLLKARDYVRFIATR